jgi:uncharacterized membrane protein YjjB (DUF3815 family)
MISKLPTLFIALFLGLVSAGITRVFTHRLLIITASAVCAAFVVGFIANAWQEHADREMALRHPAGYSPPE